MRINILLFAAFSLCLASCDLDEAERMDITRQKVRDVSPDVTGLTFLGRRQVSIDSLLGPALGLPTDEVWKPVVGDSGTWSSIGWVVRGWWKDSLVFSAWSSLGSGTWLKLPVAGEWMRHPGEVRSEFVLLHTWWRASTWYGNWQTDTVFPSGSFSLQFLQDFNELHWDTAFARKTPRNGDTLRLKVGVDRGSPGRSDSMPVFADYSGLRTVGDYIHYLKPNDTATLTWVVTGTAGDSLHLELGWGKFGESHSFGFRVAR
jgi:hypothetical protein